MGGFDALEDYNAREPEDYRHYAREHEERSEDDEMSDKDDKNGMKFHFGEVGIVFLYIALCSFVDLLTQ